MRIPALYAKLVAGYLLLFVIIACFIGIILNERSKKQQIEDTVTEIRNLRYLVDTAHRQIAELSLLGESVAGWEETDRLLYKEKTATLDSILSAAEPLCKEFIPYEQIDSLRGLFSQKEMFMSRLVSFFLEQAENDGRLFRELPVISRKAMKEENSKKPRGLRIFKKKERNTENPSLARLHLVSETLARRQSERMRLLESYIDSLQCRNKSLNRQMNMLVASLDTKVRMAIEEKENDIQNLHVLSFVLIACGISSSLLLLGFLFYVTYRDRKKYLAINRMLEEALKRNDRLVERQKKILLAVSHDVRGPLGAILNSAELAADIREKKRRNIHLGNIQGTCRHILGIVNDLMDVYRIEEEKETVNAVPFRLKPVLDRISETYSERANAAGLMFKSEYDGTNAVVCGDPDRVERILDNLLSNAVKFTPNGNIGLAASYKDGILYLVVRDTGIGMSEEVKTEVFEPLVRAAPDVNADGFGLGLSIVRGLVTNMSGQLDVKSEVGKGSVFRVSLPLPETDGEAQPAEIRPCLSAALPKRVIAVDDDRVQLAVLREMLERNGIACRACDHVKEVIAALREGEYDLILTDIQMAGTGGFELLSLLRSSNIGNSRTIPVAAMTARGDDRKGVYLDAGFCDCIFKPFSMKELLPFLTAQMSREETDSGIDFSALTDGVNDKPEILRLFISESTREMEKLEEGLRHGDRTAMRETLHHMLPAWTILRCEDMLHAYRDVLRDGQTDIKALEEETARVVLRIRGLISDAGEELTKLEHEEENTDR